MNKRRRVLWSSLCMLTLCGCSMDGLSPQAREQLQQGLLAYQRGDDASTVAQANVVLSETRRGEGAMQAFYLRGMARFRQGEIDSARDDLLEVSRRSKDPVLRGKALDALGEIAYRRGDDEAAVEYLTEAVERLTPGEPPSDHARYRLGCSLQRLGRWTDADLHFQRVMYHFPDTELARRSRIRANGRAWTIQVGSYAERKQARLAEQQWQQISSTVRVEPELRDGQLHFLLHAGRWERFDQARKELPDIRETTPDAFITVTR